MTKSSAIPPTHPIIEHAIPDHEHHFPRRQEYENARSGSEHAIVRNKFPSTGTPDSLLHTTTEAPLNIERSDLVTKGEHIVPEPATSGQIGRQDQDWLDTDAAK